MSPDRKTIVTTTVNFQSKKVQYHIIFWDAETQKELKKTSLPGSPVCLKFNRDGSDIALGFNESDIDEYAKYFTQCRGDKRYKLGIWVFDTETKKRVKELPVLQTYNKISDIEFDYNNKDVIYSSYGGETYSYKISTNKCSGIYGTQDRNLSFYKDYLITRATFYNSEGLLFISTKDEEQKLEFKNINYEPFYIDDNFKNDSRNLAPFLFLMYDYNSSDVKWVFINKNGDYDCYGNMDEYLKYSSFPTIQPLQKKQGLLKEYSNSTFDRKLAQFLYDNKWNGEKAKKEVFEYSNIPFDYYEIFKMKRPETAKPDQKLTEQEWEEQATLAREKLIKEGYTIIDEKLRSGTDYVISADVTDDNTILACVALCEEGPGSLIIDGRPNNARKEIPLNKEKGLQLYSKSNFSEYKVGKYVFEIYGSGKSYLIVASKKGAEKVELSKAETESLMIESTLKDMEQRGFEIIETRTATVGYGKPLAIPIEYGGEFAWTAIAPDNCGTLTVFTNGVSNGHSFIKNDFTVNSGTVTIQQGNKIEFRANVTGCNNAKIILMIGVK